MFLNRRRAGLTPVRARGMLRATGSSWTSGGLRDARAQALPAALVSGKLCGYPAKLSLDPRRASQSRVTTVRITAVASFLLQPWT